MKIPYLGSISAIFERRYAKWSIIPMLHRVGVMDSGRLHANETLKISPELLEAFICVAKKARWAFLSLDEIAFELGAGRVPKRSICMTLDDGYRDNLTHAYPIFRSMGVPFCIYVTTGLVDATAGMWWYQLEALLQRNASLTGPSGASLSCGTASEKAAAFTLLKRDIMSLDDQVRAGAVSWLRSQWQAVPIDALAGESMLSWVDLRTLSDDPLVTIGAHTLTHPVLATLPAEQSRYEIAESGQTLARHTGKPVRHFAYPFGGLVEAGPREYEYARTSGYTTAVTTRNGLIQSGIPDPFALPRVAFTEAPLQGVVAAFGARRIRLARGRLAGHARNAGSSA